ncbi:hypothetical protein C7A12_17400 [Pseudomonas fluorescens]|nr:hypothetical protein C7A12_17400 [Pseudomonas fluorescens]
MLCVGTHPVTLRVTTLRAGRGASRVAFPRRAWERSESVHAIQPRAYSALHNARQLSSIRLEKPHSLSYHANTLSSLPLTLV